MGDGNDIVRAGDVGGILRHGGHAGVGRVLHDGQTARAANGHEARRAIEEATGEDHADHALTIIPSRGAKRGSTAWAVIVFARIARQRIRPSGEEQTAIGRRHVDVSRQEWNTTLGVDRGSGRAPTEDLRQNAPRRVGSGRPTKTVAGNLDGKPAHESQASSPRHRLPRSRPQ